MKEKDYLSQIDSIIPWGEGKAFATFSCHLTIAAVRYMILSVRHRENMDSRIIGELFWLFIEEVTDISFDRSLWLILSVLLETVHVFFHISDSQMEKFFSRFYESVIGAAPKGATAKLSG